MRSFLRKQSKGAHLKEGSLLKYFLKRKSMSSKTLRETNEEEVRQAYDLGERRTDRLKRGKTD